MRFLLVCVASALPHHAYCSTIIDPPSHPAPMPASVQAIPLAETDLPLPDVGNLTGVSDAIPVVHSAGAPQRRGLVPAIHTRQELCETLIVAAVEHGIPVSFFARLIWKESAFRTTVVSRAGAQGIAQFMPGTAALFGIEPFDPEQALPASARFLSDLYRQFGNHGLAAAAYNAGPARVRNWLARRAKLPSETRNYVVNITGRAPEQWVGTRQSIADLKIPDGTQCQELAATVTAAQKAQAARWSPQTTQSTRPRAAQVRAEAARRPPQQREQPQPVKAAPVRSASQGTPMQDIYIRPDHY